MTSPRRAEPTTAIIARRVRKLRRDQELTAEDVAAHLTRLGVTGWDRSTVSAYEAGRRKATSVTLWLALASALNVAPLDLIAPEDGEPVPLTPVGPPIDARTARRWITGGRPCRVRSGTAAPRAVAGGAKVVESIEDRLARLEATIGAES
jgi:transcriptional regulator with XRE-family HTH domain